MLRFGIFLLIVAVTIFGYFIPQFAAYPAAVSPLVAVASLSGSQISVAAFVALCFIVPCTIKRRFFCRTVCPLGFCFNVIAKLRKSRLPKLLERIPSLGIFLALSTLLGTTLGAVGFLWLDPLVLFASPLRSGVGLLPILGGVLLLALLVPTFWCRTICPLGGFQEILYVPKSFTVKPSLDSTDDVSIKYRRKLLRLWILTFLFGGMFEFLRRQTSSASTPLRPPGAIPEPFFLALCARCGTCSHVCPTKLLTTNCENASILDWGTPHLQFDPAWCRDDCIACTQSCPSGALRRIESNKKKDVKIGFAVFEFQHCRLYDDRECTFCGRECPFDAIHYEWSEEEYRRVVKIDTEVCTGCGRCIVSCPVKGTDRPLNVEKFQPSVESQS